jgi:Tfp pilus assembly protein PilV
MRLRQRSQKAVLAFTLLEVMIALGIFFMAMFTILALVSNTLRNARALQEADIDPGMLAAQLSLTNRLTEGSESGDFGDFYRDYNWDKVTTHITNSLWQVDFVVHHRVRTKSVDTPLSVLVYSPMSQALPGGGAPRR